MSGKNIIQLLLLSHFRSVQLCATPQTTAHQSPLSLGFSRQEYWSGVAISFSNACMHAKSLQLCPTLCYPMDSSPRGSSVHRILQARVLEWVAISFSKIGSYSSLQLTFSLNRFEHTVPVYPCPHYSSKLLQNFTQYRLNFLFSY